MNSKRVIFDRNFLKSNLKNLPNVYSYLHRYYLYNYPTIINTFQIQIKSSISRFTLSTIHRKNNFAIISALTSIECKSCWPHQVSHFLEILSSILRKIKKRQSSKVLRRVVHRVHRDFTPLIVITCYSRVARRGTRV